MNPVSVESSARQMVMQTKMVKYQQSLDLKKEFVSKRTLFQSRSPSITLLKTTAASLFVGGVLAGTPSLLVAMPLYAFNLISFSSVLNIAGSATVLGTLLLNNSANLKILKEFDEANEAAQSFLTFIALQNK